MLRAILTLGMLVATATAGAQCELDSTTMVDHAVQAALAIWAADKRCNGAIVREAPVKCTTDVATSIQELSEVGTAIGDMLGACGNLKLENHECAAAADAVFTATAGLTAAGATIADDCAKIVPKQFDDDVLDTATQLGKCTADAAGSMNSFFAAHNAVQHMKESCEGEHGCKVDAFEVVNVLSEFGAYIAGAYSECSTYDAESKHQAAPDVDAADCSKAVLEGINSLSSLTELGLKMHKACNIKDERLYSERAGVASAMSSSSLFAMAAAIPAAAVVSFIAGSRFAKARQQRDTSAAGSLVELE